MRILTLSGFSASSRRDKWTLDKFADHAANRAFKMRQECEKEMGIDKVEYPVSEHFFSSSSSARGAFLLELTRTDGGPTAAFGKSFGGSHLWWDIYKYHKEIFRNRDKTSHLKVFLIDSHGAVLGDGRLGPYRASKSMRFNKAWLKYMDEGLLSIHVFRQDVEGLTGALIKPPRRKLDESVFTQKDLDCGDHWSITDPHAQSGGIVASYVTSHLYDMLSW